jgi:2-succinyl-5-enolpyruvyl-6-hydroxy-3-cyclohexene-1-carboxylate synthase
VDPTNRNTALASALVEELARCGVRHAALSPGSRSTPLAVALSRQPAIDLTILIDERCAGFFALGAAQATRRPVAVLCTSGTAAANLHPAVCEADESAMPLIVLTADRPPELRGIGAGQTIDQLKFYGEAVRWFCEVGTHEADDGGLLHYRAVACRAFAAARGEPRPGPVHLNLPWREPLAPIPVEGAVTATSPLALEGRGERPLSAVAYSAPAPEGPLLDELAERIEAEPRGLILAGRQLDPALREPLAGLARQAGYPLLAEPTSQLRLGPHDRSAVVSSYDPIARARAAELEPELVIRFGEMPTSKPLRLWLADLPQLRQVVVDPAFGWNEPSRFAETLVRADGPTVASGLASRLAAAEQRSEWLSSWLRADRAAADAMRAHLEAIEEPSEPGVQLALGAALANGDLVYTASSMPIRDQEAFLPPGEADVLFLCNRGANGIDGLVSSAAGAAAASGKRTWLVLGDLALFHDMNGLAAARGLEGLRIVVVDNRGGGIFDFLPQAEALPEAEFEALLGTPSGIEIARVAALYGLSHRRVGDRGELEDALVGEATIVEVPVDRRRNVEIHRVLAESAVSALASP